MAQSMNFFQGESKNTEYKESLPKNAEKYVKTVVAFANTQGGRLVFGVSDGTGEVVGIGEDALFQAMDSISNAISDSCEPQIVPSIEPHTVDGKSIIVVTVAPEPHRPYYLKSKGKDGGTYIRIGGTTRPAGPEKVKELEMEGARISWDEQTCVGYAVADRAIQKLCRDMNARRKEMQGQKGSAAKLPVVTRQNLENWKLLRKVDGKYLASNAFVLLTSDYFPFSKTQCAVFKGSDRGVFLDKRVYSGPLCDQVDEAVQFVLRNIRLGASIEGMQRKESYELPVDAVREMIVNAHCHRNMLDESCVQVALYDDRLEVTSPGGLYNGLTLEEALQGHSRLRNRAIANVFSQIGMAEAWGTGLERIRRSARESGLPEPEFIDMPESFRVNLYRRPYAVHTGEIFVHDGVSVGEKGNNFGKTDNYVGKMAGIVGEKHDNAEKTGGVVGERKENVGEKSADTPASRRDAKERVLRMISSDRRISAAEIAKRMSVANRTAERYIRELREEGSLVRHGAARGGYWEVVEH